MKKYIGKVGSGTTIHIIFEDYSEQHERNFYYTPCGADHATNRSGWNARPIQEFDETKVTCKKCLKYLARRKKC